MWNYSNNSVTMAQNDFFDKDIVLKIIGRHFQKLMKLSQQEFANKLWKNQSYVNQVLNWKTAVTKNQLLDFAYALWMNDDEWEELVKYAKKAEYEQTTGEKLEIIPEITMNMLEDIDFENDELLKVVMKREFGKEPTPEDIQTILSVIRMKKGK